MLLPLQLTLLLYTGQTVLCEFTGYTKTLSVFDIRNSSCHDIYYLPLLICFKLHYQTEYLECFLFFFSSSLFGSQVCLYWHRPHSHKT